MTYLTRNREIETAIQALAHETILWLDTEVAEWWTPTPKLSLIQALTDEKDMDGTSAYLLDVLKHPTLACLFINKVMENPKIEKVFHNASYDLRFLGKERAQNVTCTLKLAKQWPKTALGVPDYKLKTLAKELCGFTNVDAEQQSSNWGKRPLNAQQLLYAKMDTVYVAQVHRYLKTFAQRKSAKAVTHPSPTPKSSAASPTEKAPLSVTKVRVAFECPRLFYLAHCFGGKTMFLPKEQTHGIGSAFHELSDRFVQAALDQAQFQELFEPSYSKLDSDAITSRMQDAFYNLVFYPYLQETIQTDPGRATALTHLWQGLRSLIQRWTTLLISNRRHCSATDLFSKTFLAQELSVQHQFMLPDGSHQLVRGRFDSLVYDFEQHRLCVVEYKTYQSIEQSAQLAQVALYSYMLKERVGVPIDSAVYSVLPNLKELTFTWDELAKTVHQMIPHKLQQMNEWVDWQPGDSNPPPPTPQPHLCDICPQQSKCQSFFLVSEESTEETVEEQPPVAKPSPSPVSGPAPSAPPKKTQENATESQDDSNADEIAENLIQTLQAFGVDVTYTGAAVGPAFIRVKLKPAPGVKVNSILKLSDDLRVQLGIISPPMIAPQAGYVSIDLPRPDRKAAFFDQYLQSQTVLPTDPTQIAIGVNLDGKLVEADLSDPNTCHFLVGGTTGSGKSEFLRSLLLSLLARHSPETLKVALVDPKRVTFPEFEKNPWLFTSIVKDSERAIDLMEDLVAEMDSRYQKFEMNGCNDLSRYNQKYSQRPDKLLPRIVCIFDEYADFMAEKEVAQALELSIKRLGAMARAAGIHLVIATQRPEAKVVTPIIRSNLPGRVALRTASEADSMIILGGKQTGAASLLGKGDLLYQAGANLLRLQSLFAPEIDLSHY